MEYEIIQQHEYQDIYRLQYGCLLKINKYKHLGGWITSAGLKDKIKKIKGIKNCFILLEEYKGWNKIYSKNTIILDTIPIELVNKNEYWIEIKFSGGTFQGNIKEYEVFKKKIDEILNKYKEEN